MWDVDREFQQLFLREVILVFRHPRGRLTLGQEDLARATDHVAALVLKRRVPLPHLVPDAAQRVVGQELDHVPGREELIAEGQFVGVAWCLALLAGLIPKFLGREILVDPADGLVLRPDLRPSSSSLIRAEHVVEHPLRRVEPVRRIVGAEQNADLVGEPPAQPVEEMAVGNFLVTRVEESLVLGVVGEVEFTDRCAS